MFGTRYLRIGDGRGGDAFTVFFETAHTDGTGTRYDLILRFDYFGSGEVELIPAAEE